jgi:6-phosphogluconolactonase (cycloisomerase 2 family)
MSEGSRRYFFVAVMSLCAAGCGGSGSSPSDGSGSYTVAGVISGLDAPGLMLVNGAEAISPPAGATTFAFPTAIANGTSYGVTVQTQPVGTTCAVSNGPMASATVTNVQVACSPQEYLYLGARGFSVNFKNGELTELAGSPFGCGGVGDPSGHFLVGLGGVCRIHPRTGALSDADGTTYSAPGWNDVAIDPTGRFLYFSAADTAHAVYGFSIDRQAELLTAVPRSPYTAGLQPKAISVDRSGKFVYVLNEANSKTTVSAYSIDQQSGALAEISGSPFNTGVSFVSSSGSTYAPHACDIETNPHGDFIHAYVLDDQWGRVYTYSIDPVTGALSAPVQTGTSASTNTTSVCGQLALHPSGAFLYASTRDGQKLFFEFNVDLATGMYLTKTSPVLRHTWESFGTTYTEGADPVAFAVDPSGQFLYVGTSTGRLAHFGIDPVTGGVPFIGHAMNVNNPNAFEITRPKP